MPPAPAEPLSRADTFRISTGPFPLVYWQNERANIPGDTKPLPGCRQDQDEKTGMLTREATPDRLSAFSDGVFAVIITILVLELKPPEASSLEALFALWPAAIGYGVSYLFIAIVWVNHHHLFRHAGVATARLIWGNFAHLFTVSLIPFSTAWIARTELAAVPVAVYATVFVAVNATYLLLCMEAVDRLQSSEIPRHARRLMRIRSLVTLALFLLAAAIALKYPKSGMALICLCLIVYLRPEAPGIQFSKPSGGKNS